MSVGKAFNLTTFGLVFLVCVAVLWSDLVSFEEHTHHIAESISSPDGTILATLSDDGETITLSDKTTGEERNWKQKSVVWSMAFSPDGRTLVSGGINGIGLWDVAKGKEQGRLDVGEDNSFPKRSFVCFAFSPDGKTLASGQIFGSVWLWDRESGKRRFLEEPDSLYDSSVDYPVFVAFSPDGKTLASVIDEKVALWDVKSGKHTVTLTEEFPYVTFTTDGIVVLLEKNKRVKILEVAYVQVGCIGVLGAIVFLYLTGSLRRISCASYRAG